LASITSLGLGANSLGSAAFAAALHALPPVLTALAVARPARAAPLWLPGRRRCAARRGAVRERLYARSRAEVQLQARSSAVGQLAAAEIALAVGHGASERGASRFYKRVGYFNAQK
jgi:hypothetical protein